MPRTACLPFAALLLASACALAAPPAATSAAKVAHSPRAPAAAMTDDALFVQALQMHREGRHAGAWGRFVALADRGHPDGARWALMMLRYSVPLYRTQYGASEEQVGYWTWVASQAPRLQVVHNGE